MSEDIANSFVRFAREVWGAMRGQKRDEPEGRLALAPDADLAGAVRERLANRL
ncbi:hypothetical protein [Mesorhizobium sp. M1A.F.Ca.ET.072.01.1.1]|uniref:hypothetical protein n=1 Tax=Mesorhizobium sp. M1A.F.Ca.ET.072.01.1.1 TaxID=2496753 RepID=UPI0016744C75|nr:hypothetical protein [Mesorhizobium sp. M1A.F.Ca.ET.072.01.1.1]